MITIDEKLYITKEVNNIIISYSKSVVIRKLLLTFSFEEGSNNKTISPLLENANFCNGDLNPDIEFELFEFIHPFLKELNKNDTTALYFWTINNLYLNYLEVLEHTDDENFHENDSDKVFYFKFGRALAHKIYDPESTALDDELYEELKTLLISYASEFDLSLIDKYTKYDVLEMIERYCE